MPDEDDVAIGAEIAICRIIDNHGETGDLLAWRSDALQQPGLAGVTRRLEELMSIAFVGL